MAAVVKGNIDDEIANADWPKRTPDRLADLEGSEPSGPPPNVSAATWAIELEAKYNPSQPRDSRGRFGSGGGSGGSAGGGGGLGLAPPAEDSMTANMVDGKFTPERAELHASIIDGKLEGVPSSTTPTLYMTGGGPASGKSSGLINNPETGIPGAGKAAHIDPDSMKAELPEYQSGIAGGKPWAAAHVHEESSYLAKSGVSTALTQGKDVVYDSVGDSGIDKLQSKVEGFRASGATRIQAEYATVSTAEAIRRSDARGAVTGRFVPHEVITAAHADVSRTFVAAVDRGVFDSARLWDTGSKAPRLVASYDRAGAGLTVHQQDLWDSFVAKGNE